MLLYKVETGKFSAQTFLSWSDAPTDETKEEFMQDKPWIEKLTPDNLPNEDLRIVASLIGLDVAVKMMDVLSGLTINIPRYGYRKARERYIAQNYDGTRKSLIKLVLECDVTEGYVRTIARKYKIKELE